MRAISGKLPDGSTVEGLYQSRMQELAESVADLGKSSSVPFQWDLEMYSQPGVVPAGLEGGGPEKTGGCTGPADTGAGTDPPGTGPGTTPTGVAMGCSTGRRGDPALSSSLSPVFRVEVGEFVALATPPSQKESIFVGKVLSTKAGDGGDELELRWYMPVRVPENCTRSNYGKGKWTAEYVREFGKLVPSVGVESVGAVTSKFLALTSQDKLPSHVWAALAENTLLPSEEECGGEGQEDEEEEEQGESEGEDGGDKDESGQGEGEGEAEDPVSALTALTRAMPRPNVRLTAAFSRPRRNVSG